MLVVHVIRQFFPAQGGMENVVYHLALQQMKLGWSVRVVTLDRIFKSEVTLPCSETIDGIDVRRMSFRGSERYPLAPTVLKHIRDAELLHVHGIDFFFDFLSTTSWFHRKRMVVSTHGGFFHSGFAQRLKAIYFATVTRFSIRSYAKVLASSAQDARIFSSIRSYGLQTIENGVDTRKFAGISPSEDRKSIIYFGRFSPHKNIALLFPLLSALQQIDPGWSLILAGRAMGQTAEELKELGDKLGIGASLTVLQSPSDTELRDLIAKSSVFCSPSSYEGFGIAAVEAMSAGLVAVLSDIPAHRSTIEAAGLGYLVDFQDADGTARKIVEVVQDAGAVPSPANLERLSETFAWDGVAKTVNDVYQSVLGINKRLILKTSLEVLGTEKALETVGSAIAAQRSLRVAFVNAHLALAAHRSNEIARTLRGFLLLNDGIGVDLASRLLFGSTFPANLNGTDFVPKLLDRLKPGCRVYLLGGSSQVIAAAAKRFEHAWPRLAIVGCHHGFFSEHEAEAIAEEIRQARPDVALVGMGAPRQELWLSRYIPDVCPVGIGVGALFDFQTGTIRRAPFLMRAARFEWLFRLILEPKRLMRRYVAGNPTFLLAVTRQWLSGVRA